MFDSATLVFFIGTSLLLALAPGPDNIFVLTQSAIRGPLVGIVVTFGLCTGLVVHTIAVVLGLAVLVQSSALAFLLLKCLGAAYLLYLAYGAFRAEAASLKAGTNEVGANEAKINEVGACEVETTRNNMRSFYLRGILMNVTNPKVSVFFLAFLPQFSDPSRGHLSLQLLVLGALFMISALIVFVGISLLAGLLAEPFRRSARVRRALNVSAGLIFTGLALKLLFSAG